MAVPTTNGVGERGPRGGGPRRHLKKQWSERPVPTAVLNPDTGEEPRGAPRNQVALHQGQRELSKPARPDKGYLSTRAQTGERQFVSGRGSSSIFQARGEIPTCSLPGSQQGLKQTGLSLQSEGDSGVPSVSPQGRFRSRPGARLQPAFASGPKQLASFCVTYGFYWRPLKNYCMCSRNILN